MCEMAGEVGFGRRWGRGRGRVEAVEGGTQKAWPISKPGGEDGRSDLYKFDCLADSVQAKLSLDQNWSSE